MCLVIVFRLDFACGEELGFVARVGEGWEKVCGWASAGELSIGERFWLTDPTGFSLKAGQGLIRQRWQLRKLFSTERDQLSRRWAFCLTQFVILAKIELCKPNKEGPSLRPHGEEVSKEPD